MPIGAPIALKTCVESNMGYTVILDDYCTIVDRDTDATVVQTAAINGIYVIYLNQLIHLQELKLEQNLKMNSAVEEEDDLKLLHERTGHVNWSTLIEACRCKLVPSLSRRNAKFVVVSNSPDIHFERKSKRSQST